MALDHESEPEPISASCRATRATDYWIVNLPQHRLEVYRHPVADTGGRYGWRYRDVTVLDQGDGVAPLAISGARIAVADLLP